MTPREDAATTVLLIIVLATALGLVGTWLLHRVEDFLADCRERRHRNRTRAALRASSTWTRPVRYVTPAK